jgi:hypothetical protein
LGRSELGSAAMVGTGPDWVWFGQVNESVPPSLGLLG